MEDLFPLTAHLLALTAEKRRIVVAPMPRECLEIMMRHTWPGNVRELDLVIQRAVRRAVHYSAHSGLVTITPECLVIDAPSAASKKSTRGKWIDISREELERHLKEADYNVARASRDAGLAVGTFWRRIKLFDIPIRGAAT